MSLSPAEMWMPGAPKKPVNNNSSSSSNKRPRTEQAPKAAQLQQQLSGATRNMRFMQRNISNSNSNSSVSPNHQAPPLVNKQDGTTVQERTTTATAADITTTTSSTSCRRDDGAAAVPVERATPLDMYGREQCLVLGRRSFGGFNPVTAENWYAQQQQEGQRQEKARESKRATAGLIVAQSDAELLRRYRDLAHGRNGNDARKPQRPTSARSTRQKGGISNQTKRNKGGLDDVLGE